MSVQQHTGVIYMLTNQITGERYVGRTIDFPKRMRKYKSGNGHAGIGESIAKYGWNNFAVVKLEEGISDVDLPSREDYYIAKLEPELNLMTSTSGGCVRHAESSKRLISEAMKGREFSPEHRAKLSVAGVGRKVSLETCARLSAANKGKPKSLETRAKMSAKKRGENHPLFGKTRSAETRAKISAANSGENHPNFGKKLSPKTCAKLSASKKGKPKSTEHRAKIGAANRKPKSPAGRANIREASRERHNIMRKHRAIKELRAIGWPLDLVNEK